ncbi:MAG TPA: permease-like cell division protein FtsX [Rhodanobacteraceae bacterium]|nr:permease-like cell division protein FtsX [Rhodanobacteraceae bacterium]
MSGPVRSTPGNAKSPPRRGRLAVWREQHGWGARAAAQRLAAQPVATLLAVAVMGLALSLPLAFAMVLGNVRQLASGLGDSQGLSVFLQPSVDAQGAEALAAGWRQRGDVSAVDLHSPAQGASELARMQGFADALAALGHNPLPWVALVQPRTGLSRSRLAALVADLRRAPQVDLVQDQQAWRDRAQAVLALGSRTLLLLAVLMAVGALLVIGSNVRQDIRSRADEIGILQRVGASRRFIARPYLYSGAACGFGAGLLAAAVLLLVEWLLAAPAGRLAAAYGGQLVLRGLDPRLLLAVPPAAAALGWLGARLALGELQRDASAGR